MRKFLVMTTEQLDDGQRNVELILTFDPTTKSLVEVEPISEGVVVDIPTQ